MLPRAVRLSGRPARTSGKVDRQALAALPKTRNVRRRDEVLSDKRCRKAVGRECWQELLGISDVGVDDDFLGLGGHSLTATQLTARIRDLLGIDLSLRAVFEHALLGQLAQLIEKNISAAPSIHDGSIRGHATASPATEQPANYSRRAPPAKEDCNLVVVVDERFELASFERLAEEVRSLDCRYLATAVPDTPEAYRAVPDLPTLVLRRSVIRHLPTSRGRVCCGAPLSKHEEYQALERAGVPRYPVGSARREIRDPTFGARDLRREKAGSRGEGRGGSDSAARARAVAPSAWTAAAGRSEVTVLRALHLHRTMARVSYRVNTLFGNALYAIELRLGPTARRCVGRRTSIRPIAKKECRWSPTPATPRCDSARRRCDRAGGACPRGLSDDPAVGCGHPARDAVRPPLRRRGRCADYNWNSPSESGAEWPVDVESQFDGVRKAAGVFGRAHRAAWC